LWKAHGKPSFRSQKKGEQGKKKANEGLLTSGPKKGGTWRGGKAQIRNPHIERGGGISKFLQKDRRKENIIRWWVRHRRTLTSYRREGIAVQEKPSSRSATKGLRSDNMDYMGQLSN